MPPKKKQVKKPIKKQAKKEPPKKQRVKQVKQETEKQKIKINVNVNIPQQKTAPATTKKKASGTFGTRGPRGGRFVQRPQQRVSDATREAEARLRTQNIEQQQLIKDLITRQEKQTQEAQDFKKAQQEQEEQDRRDKQQKQTVGGSALSSVRFQQPPAQIAEAVVQTRDDMLRQAKELLRPELQKITEKELIAKVTEKKAEKKAKKKASEELHILEQAKARAELIGGVAQLRAERTARRAQEDKKAIEADKNKFITLQQLQTKQQIKQFEKDKDEFIMLQQTQTRQQLEQLQREQKQREQEIKEASKKEIEKTKKETERKLKKSDDFVKELVEIERKQKQETAQQKEKLKKKEQETKEATVKQLEIQRKQLEEAKNKQLEEQKLHELQKVGLMREQIKATKEREELLKGRVKSRVDLLEIKDKEIKAKIAERAATGRAEQAVKRAEEAETTAEKLKREKKEAEEIKAEKERIKAEKQRETRQDTVTELQQRGIRRAGELNQLSVKNLQDKYNLTSKDKHVLINQIIQNEGFVKGVTKDKKKTAKFIAEEGIKKYPKGTLKKTTN